MHRLNIRQLIQTGVLLATLWVGIQFLIFVYQLSGGGAVTVSRPGGVEAFLPIGALMGWKRYVLTGLWDHIHPAAMIFLGFAVVISILFRKSFCSWFCPIGTSSEWAWRLAKRVGVPQLNLPWVVDFLLRSIKYLLLGFFLWAVLTMSTESIAMFLESPYYKVSDVKMLHFFTRMSQVTAIVLAVLVVGSFFISNFWCRYFCPYGALLGLVSLLSPSRIERDKASCISCGKCTTACPHRIKVDQKSRVLSPECTACLDCVDKCPVQDTINLKMGYQRFPGKLSPGILGGIILIGFSVVVLSAKVNDRWDSQVSHQELRQLIEQIDAPHMGHPGTKGTF